MKTIKWIVGIDGGGSGTRGILFNATSYTPVKYVVGGSTNYHNVGFEKAVRNLSYVIDSLTRDRDVDPLIVLGLAGLDSKYDWSIWRKYLDNTYRNYVLMHDVKMTLYAASYGEPGIVVIAGTGFNAYGWDGVNQWYSGNWGWKVGDEPSAYSIGREALRHVLRFIDGRGPRTLLYEAVLEYLKLVDKDDLVNWIYDASPSQIASVAPIVCSLYHHDDIARSILENAVSEALISVLTVSSKLGSHLPVHYTGGLFRCQHYRDLFLDGLRRHGLEIGKYILHPIVGAIIAGIRKLSEASSANYEAIVNSIHRYLGDVSSTSI
jgi:N-acetylglucosamine kinase-like BadF-type ATPase